MKEVRSFGFMLLETQASVQVWSYYWANVAHNGWFSQQSNLPTLLTRKQRKWGKERGREQGGACEE